MKPVFIYALLDPRTGEIRYLGQTDNPDERLYNHIKYAPENKYHNARWIKSLLSKNLRPVMEILDVVPDTEADFWEREYIQNFRERGFDLTNATPGGMALRGSDNPNFGKTTPPEVIAKIKASLTGEKNPMFGKKGESHPSFGYKCSPEQCWKRSLARKGKKGKPPSIAAREKISAFSLNRKSLRNTSGFVGVGWHRASNKWRAWISKNKKQRQLGVFSKLEDAIFVRALGVALYCLK